MSTLYGVPTDTDNMKYNFDLHKYVLTIDGVKNLLNEDLVEWLQKDEFEANIYLEEISEDVYGYIYDNSLVQTVPIKEYLLAKYISLREVIERALVAQVRYDMRSGGGLLKDQHGVSIEKVVALENNILMDRSISTRTKRILSQSGILYRGTMYLVMDGKYRSDY